MIRHSRIKIALGHSFESNSILVVIVFSACGSPLLRAAEVDFVRDIEPILANHCYYCHGEDDQQGRLRLDAKHIVRQGGISGPLIVPGKSGESLLIKRLAGLGDEKQMPLDEDPLSKEQIDLIRAWIDQGAPWPDGVGSAAEEIPRHWAYVAPVRPALPTVQRQSWARTPIDAFILARLEREGIAPSPEADRATLVRRVYLDLLGLPPSVAEVDAFLADARPDAYERLVDRLLASSTYGERWALPWLDLARYGDSHGAHRDELRESWPYRDWVIRALNADMPYDQFTIEQIAGDLLPHATDEQRLATGFHRATVTNLEAGIDFEETRVTQVLDRVQVTGTVWLGATLQCAQCHNHKFDPITQKEFYRLFSFFNNTPGEVEAAPGKIGSNALSGPYLTLELDDGKAIDKVKPLKTLVMAEMEEPRTSRIFRRGDFRNPGDKVEPGTPRILHSFFDDFPRNRLGLARWLVDPQNPLVARVAVNRWWAEIFGRGLVRTPDDFGLQGATPSHPELLDWLAVEFVEGGWSTKRMLRQMVLSSTYCQSSHVTVDALRRDPGNALLGRAARRRLAAESLRDNALAIGGLLSPQQGGPPVFPSQPANLWRRGADDNYSPLYVPSQGDDAYRRGVYVVFRRTVPYPSFVNFDVPDRTTCTASRWTTTTPLQALTLLNDPVYLECALAFAHRLSKERASLTDEQQVVYALRVCMARVPHTEEVSELLTLYRRKAEIYGDDPQAARELIEGVRGGLVLAAKTSRGWLRGFG